MDTLGGWCALMRAGWDSEQALKQHMGWVVRKHDITYRLLRWRVMQSSCGHGLPILQIPSRRKYLICRPADATVLAKVETRWVYVDLAKIRSLPFPVT